MLLARLGHRLGFTNPTLYRLLATAPSVYHDVTGGNNCAQVSGPCVAGNLYPATAIEAVASLDAAGLAGFDRDDLVATSNIPALRIGAFAVIVRDRFGRLERILEKPSRADVDALARPVLVSMNLWRFDARIFDACRDVPMSARGEFELPSAVMLARDRGVEFAVVPSAGPVLDLSQRDDIAEVARRLGAGA